MSLARQRTLRDINWVRQSFLVPTDNNNKPLLEEKELRNRTFTTARFKFVDTTPGGNICINPPPQFTRNADIKVGNIFTARDTTGRSPTSTGSRGLGRYYSEAIDDNMRIISMRFGVPQFNSLTTFFTGFYNADAGALARTGRIGNTSSIIYSFFRAATFVITMLSLPILFLNLAGNIYRFLAGNPSSKYYYLKPTMPLYWSAVNTMVNMIAVNKGIVPRFMDKETRAKIGDNRFNFTEEDLARFNTLLPDVFMKEGGIDVYALSTRGQRLARRVWKKMDEVYAELAKKGNAYGGDIALAIDEIERRGLEVPSKNYVEFAGLLRNWLKAAMGGLAVTVPAVGAATVAANAAGTAANAVSGDASKDASQNKSVENGQSLGIEVVPQTEEGLDLPGWQEYLDAELDDGSTFISFRVDSEGPVTESFSNTVGESDIQSKFNGMSGDSRSTSFSFAGGNIAGDTAVGALVQTVMGAAADAVAGIRDGLQLSGLAALGGAAFVDIPQHWQSSVAQLPSMNYSVTLTSPYGNKLSQLTNIYIPLSMLLAAALPLSTGKQSYTSPFLVEIYDRGRAQTRLGIIDSLSISRGTANLGFSNIGEPMAVEVQFSIKDLSTVMHMPILKGFSLTTPTASVFDDDNTFTDYMAALSGMTLQEQIYTGDKLKIALTRWNAEFRSWKSPARWMQLVGDTSIARLASIWYTGVNNR